MGCSVSEKRLLTTATCRGDVLPCCARAGRGDPATGTCSFNISTVEQPLGSRGRPVFDSEGIGSCQLRVHDRTSIGPLSGFSNQSLFAHILAKGLFERPASRLEPAQVSCGREGIVRGRTGLPGAPRFDRNQFAWARTRHSVHVNSSEDLACHLWEAKPGSAATRSPASPGMREIAVGRKYNIRMRLRSLLLASAVSTLIGFGSAAHSQAWSRSFNETGVKFTLTFQSPSGNVGRFDLTPDTTGYDQRSNGYLDSVRFKAWDSADRGFVLIRAPSGTGAWIGTEASISGIPVSDAGCGGNDAGFACVEARRKGAFDVASGGPYRFPFQVAASGLPGDAPDTHVGAGYANNPRGGAGAGTTSVSLHPEPETYALMLAGLGLMGFIARRRTSG
jgi:PEP-CTERM motif